jgi:formyl-CoA transferase
LNDIVVPLEGAGAKLTSTISSPIQVHNVSKVQSRRAPALGEHNEEILKELGFSASEIGALLSDSVVGRAKEHGA